MEEKIVDIVRLNRFKKNLINWLANNTTRQSRVLHIYDINDIKGVIIDINHDLTIARTQNKMTAWFRLAMVDRISTNNVKMYLTCEHNMYGMLPLNLTLSQTETGEYKVISVE